MLSCMSTPMGLMVIGPGGRPLRLPSSNPAFRAGKDLLQLGLPAEQTWAKLLELVANPLKAMASWCGRFGVTIQEEGGNLQLNDVMLSSAHWTPLLTRLEAVSGSPLAALRLASALGAHAPTAKVGQVCMHLSHKEGEPLRLLRLERLPPEALPGDKVLAPADKGDWFFVSYGLAQASEDGTLATALGEVLQKVPSGAEALAFALDVLEQPCVLGFNRTYRCEEGTVDGWLEDFSFDSLVQARRNAADMLLDSPEVRIVNRITGDLVRLS